MNQLSQQNKDGRKSNEELKEIAKAVHRAIEGCTITEAKGILENVKNEIETNAIVHPFVG